MINFPNGFCVDYADWMQGKRSVVNGHTTHWALTAAPSNAYEDFCEYLETIFMYAGSPVYYGGINSTYYSTYCLKNATHK